MSGKQQELTTALNVVCSAAELLCAGRASIAGGSNLLTAWLNASSLVGSSGSVSRRSHTAALLRRAQEHTRALFYSLGKQLGALGLTTEFLKLFFNDEGEFEQELSRSYVNRVLKFLKKHPEVAKLFCKHDEILRVVMVCFEQYLEKLKKSNHTITYVLPSDKKQAETCSENKNGELSKANQKKRRPALSDVTNLLVYKTKKKDLTVATAKSAEQEINSKPVVKS